MFLGSGFNSNSGGLMMEGIILFMVGIICSGGFLFFFYQLSWSVSSLFFCSVLFMFFFSGSFLLGSTEFNVVNFSLSDVCFCGVYSVKLVFFIFQFMFYMSLLLLIFFNMLIIFFYVFD